MNRRRRTGGGRVTARGAHFHIDCPGCGGHVAAELCNCELERHLVLRREECPHCGYVLCDECRRDGEERR